MHENFEWGRLDGHANATVRYSDGIQEKKKGNKPTRNNWEKAKSFRLTLERLGEASRSNPPQHSRPHRFKKSEQSARAF